MKGAYDETHVFIIQRYVVKYIDSIGMCGLIRRLEPPTGKVSIVLDTDAFNEVDDQFAIAYALASKDNIEVMAINAAPFLNDRSNSPADGMLKSFDEIKRLIGMMKEPYEGPVFHGSKEYLQAPEIPVESPAAYNLAKLAHHYSPENPLYVVSVGAITNIASAILIDPSIIDKIVIVWLGGHPFHWHSTSEFNLMQDIHAGNVIFGCGAAVVQIPCLGVASHLLTTKAELEMSIGGKSALCDTLIKLFSEYKEDHFAYAKEIWDISAIAWLVNSDWVPTTLEHSPIITDRCTWSRDPLRHFCRSAYYVDRNSVFYDMFSKIANI